MSTNISLYTISGVLILDNEGHRLFAKYYENSQGGASKKNGDGQFGTVQQQLKFEEQLFSKINRVNQDILLYDNHLIAYKQANDVILVTIASINENESLIFSVASNMFEAINILLDNTVDKATILDKFDLVSLAIDETIDDGIILEIDPAIIVSRVTNAPAANMDINLKNIDISEKGMWNALSFAGKKLGERLQLGL